VGFSRVIGAIGRVLMTAGVLILLFVVYQLWGTGIREAQAQRALEDEFAELVGEPVDAPADTGSTTTTAEPAPPPPLPPEGDAVARIRIPDIGVDKIVVEGVGLDDLKRGPGHYPHSPLPGQPGNAAIAGHRTTYGAPFHDIDKLDPGDRIEVTTVQGTFVYEVSEQLIVNPEDTYVVGDFGDNRLTLTACHPKYSAAQRIVLVATLAGEAAPGPKQPDLPDETVELAGEPGLPDQPDQADQAVESLDGGIGDHDASTGPAVLLGLACGLIWMAGWVLGKLWRKWPAYLVTLPVFLVMLFFFFESFSRLLPADF